MRNKNTLNYRLNLLKDVLQKADTKKREQYKLATMLDCEDLYKFDIQDSTYIEKRKLYLAYMRKEVEFSSIDEKLSRISSLQYELVDLKTTIFGLVLGVLASLISAFFMDMLSDISSFNEISAHIYLILNIIFIIAVILIIFFIGFVLRDYIRTMILWGKDHDYFLSNDMEINFIKSQIGISDDMEEN